jgi:hypothetical protein
LKIYKKKIPTFYTTFWIKIPHFPTLRIIFPTLYYLSEPSAAGGIPTLLAGVISDL